MQLKEKSIIITGGTSGIGYEMVKILAPDNDVIVIARTPHKLDQLAQTFERVYPFQADLTRLDEVERVADAIAKRFSAIDILINNAAMQHTPTFLADDFTYESIQREITLNFTSICCLTYLLLPLLIHQDEATLLNMNSGLALAPKTSSAVYCATKAALNIFTQSLRYQLETTHIHVQQAFLDLVETPMTTGRGTHKMSAQAAAREVLKGIERNIPDHDICKVKLLRILLRIAPAIARRIMKKY